MDWGGAIGTEWRGLTPWSRVSGTREFPFLWVAREGPVDGSPLGWGLRETSECVESVRKSTVCMDWELRFERENGGKCGCLMAREEMFGWARRSGPKPHQALWTRVEGITVANWPLTILGVWFGGTSCVAVQLFLHSTSDNLHLPWLKLCYTY